MTLEPNVNTILDALIVFIVGGIWTQFKKMNGTLKSIVQWKIDHTKEHDKAWQDQRYLCDIRHGRRSYDALVPRVIADQIIREENPNG